MCGRKHEQEAPSLLWLPNSATATAEKDMNPQGPECITHLIFRETRFFCQEVVYMKVQLHIQKRKISRR